MKNNVLTYKSLECPDKDLKCILTSEIPKYVPEVIVPPSERIVNVTYSELVTLIDELSLVAGQFYKITDFQTVHYIVDTKNVKYGTNSGNTEPLIVFALSTNELSYSAYSESYPQDIIHYDWNSSNHLTDVSFATASVIITGWKGVITFRHDTIQDNYTGYDFRNVKFRRWKSAAPTWVIGTTYSDYIFVTHAGFIYCSLRPNNIGNTPALNSSYWVRCMELAKNEYWCSNSVDFSGGGTILAGIEYDDFLTFAETVGTYATLVFNNHFEKGSLEGLVTILNNNVFFLSTVASEVESNVLGFNSYGNTVEVGYNYTNVNIKSYCKNNIFFAFNDWLNIGGYFDSNISSGGESTFADVCSQNILPDYYEIDSKGELGAVLAGTYFFGNTIGYEGVGRFGNNCAYNTFDGYGSYALAGDNFQYNRIGSYSGIKCGDNCEHNVIEAHVDIYYGNVTNNFRKNTIKSRFQYGSFTGGTHIYGDYHCDLFTDSAGIAKLSYIDGAGVLTVVNPNT